MKLQRNILLPIFAAMYALLSTNVGIAKNAKANVRPTIEVYDKDLSEIACASASVLPFFDENNQRYFILTRESLGGAQGTYDDFGGATELKDTYPLEAAAREFFEEAMISKTLGLTEDDIRNYIDVDNNPSSKTLHIIAYLADGGSYGPISNVTYLVNFNAYKEQFVNEFYNARAYFLDRKGKPGTPKDEWKYREKDEVAFVSWENLKRAMRAQKNPTAPVMVSATVINPITRAPEQKNITLRDFFVTKLRPFLLNAPYKQGRNEKIRFYFGKGANSTKGTKSNKKMAQQKQPALAY